MGCCQSGSTPEEEVPAKGRNAPKDREPKDPKRDDAQPGSVNINEIANDCADSDDSHAAQTPAGQAAAPDKQQTVDDALDKIVADGWKYFILDASSNYMALPADEDMEEEDADWSVNFNPRLIPPEGFPKPSPNLFMGTPRAMDATAALAMLEACTPAPCRTHRMIEVSSQLITALNNASTLLPAHDAEGVEMGVVATVDVNLLQVTSDASQPSAALEGY